MRSPDHIAVEPKKLRRVGARLNDEVVGLADDEQGAMRLDRSGKMNLLPLAIRQIGLPKSGHR